MKACFSTLGCPDWTTRQILAALRGIGFAGLEVRGLEGEMNVPASPHLQPGSDFLRGLADSGCRVAVLGSSASFSRPDEALEECRAYVLAAAAIGCPIVRVFGGNLPEGRDRRETLALIGPALRRASSFASDHGVTIGLETHDAWCRGDEVAMVLEAVDHPALGVIWDFHHSYRHGETPAASLAAIGPGILHVHLKDGFQREGTVSYTLLGEGDLPLMGFLQGLKDIGYVGMLSLEWEKKWHPQLAEPELAFPLYKVELDRLLARLV